MKMVFANGDEINLTGVHGAARMYQGVSRDFLTFIFPEETDINEIIQNFTPENMVRFGLDDGESVSYHDNYTIVISYGFGYFNHVLGESIQTNEKCTYIIMAQSTLQERTLQQVQDTVDMIVLSSLEAGV